jgi:hypothetical protein
MSDGMSWQALSAMAAAIGLLVSGFSALRAARTQRLTNLTTVRNRIQDMYGKLGDIRSADPKTAHETKALETKQILWDEAFFNELEWLSALYLEGEVPEALMLSHLGPALVRYHDMMYLRNAWLHPSQADPGLYRCFRTVVGQFRGMVPATMTAPATAVARTTRVATATYTRTVRVDVLA